MTIFTLILCFASGFVFRAIITSFLSRSFQENICPQCRITCILPKEKRWEYRHTCDKYRSETFIQDVTLKLPDSTEEKTAAEGKTLC